MFNRNTFISRLLRAVAILLVLSNFSCTQKVKTVIDPAFSAYISAFTSGTISREASIRVRLSSDVVQTSEINAPASKNPFTFSPAIKGNAYWIDSRTIEFRPSDKMEQGKTYKSSFALSEVMKVPAKFSKFDFDFQIINQAFDVDVKGLRPLSNKNYSRQVLSGIVNTADVEDGVKVEEILSAKQNDNPLPVRWIHGDDRKVHSFEIDSIIRGDDSSIVQLAWNGKPIDVDLKGGKKVTVPAFGDFVLMSTRVEQKESEQYLLLQFSDPLMENQNLNGLITLGGQSDLRFVIEDNTIRVYPSSRESSTLNLFVDASIKNILGKSLKKEIRQDIAFEEIKPAVRLAGKGVILPSTNGLMFPFEAINLSAVDVRIVKIYENNIPQFLQVNNLEGENELTRVGRVMLKKTIQLSTLKQTDFSKWNQFTLDLSDLIKADPGSVYRVTLSFKKKYSLYTCSEVDSTEQASDNMQDVEEDWDEIDQKEASSWDYVENFYDEEGAYYDDYQWSNRDNPCKREYYDSRHWASRNVLASDLGLIAKRGMDGSMLFIATDLVTAKPLAGVDLEVYNLQNQLLKKIETDGNGLAQVSLDSKPFLLVAKKDNQRGYLKLDDGSSLSLSMFDVSGEKVQKGIKGFIYGERGVWRPGDSLYLMFMLEDKQHTLPASFPVSFELSNPQGQLVKKMVRTESVNGFYSFITSTDPEAPTGSWEAKVKVGNAVFTKPIRIETVMPNRLKIKFDFTTKYLSKDDKQSAQMEVHWLHGAVAKNLKAEVEVTLTSNQTTFPKYSEYTFDDPTRNFNADKQQLFEGNINESGKATVNADISVEDAAPGVLQANFVTRVFEPAGNFSIDRFSVPYHPYDNYVGIRMPKGDKARGIIRTDTNQIVQFVSLDKDGMPSKTKRKIEIEYYQINYRWWWDKSAEDLSNYSSTYDHRLMQRDTITTVNGVGSWILRLNYPNWGRYVIRACDLESGHCTGKVFYMDWPGWAGHAQDDGQGGPTMLTFSADKEKYTVGDQATLTIPTAKNSRALISIESGTKVIKSYWTEGQEGQTTFKFPITEDMTPNVYVNVTLVQPHSQTINDLPIRLYGLIPISVENPNTHLKPLIKMADVLQPEQKVNISVSEATGKPMTYTIAVVDDGLLDLTRFKTPDPWNAFYAREALGVKTWDMFEYVIGAWGAQLERILSIGGDEGINKPKDGAKANRFKPVVEFFGPFHLNKGETQTQSFVMPQYVGSVRTMVVAGEDGAYGSAEKTTPVRKPLMVLATLPRVLGPDEDVDLPVTVFAMEKSVKNVNVEIVPNEMFVAQGEKTKSLKFSNPDDAVVNFKLKVKPQLGIARVKVIATSGKERQETSIELDVRNPNPKVVSVIDTVLDAGQSWQTSYKPIGIAGTNKETLEVSTIPPLNLGKRLDYLIHYPYGCVEQTTSSVFPQLYLTDLLDLSPDKKAVIEKNIKAGIERLRFFQLSSGGLSYWPGDRQEDEWASNYAGHFMLEAEAKGYALPPGFIDQWKKYQRNKANSWSETKESNALTQAYRLYTLALAKAPELGSMNRLKESKNLPSTARWSLAAAYQLAGQPEVAGKLIENLPAEVKNYTELSGTYGSDERDAAIMLETLTLMGRKDKAAPLMKKLSTALCSYDFMSTQTTAYALLAIGKYVGKSGTRSSMNFTYQANGSSSQSVVSQSAVKQVEMKVNGTSPGTVSVKNNSGGMLYVQIISEGIPEIGDQTTTQTNLQMSVTYKSTSGASIDPANIHQGEDFYVEATITNPGIRGDYQNMALNQIFPSGWEILTSHLDAPETTSTTSIPTYQDIRDDRVYTYFNLKAKETKTFRIYLNASYLGKFYLPTVYAEAMYDASIHSQLPGKWVTVGEEESGGVATSSAK